ncbi:M24 family metallopeptidase [Cucumibacter marinus]|uniref:M24 family metallopeptidase n=1 Tax=Cucumibacter marinus TaxID=1121252 RepID=UPI0003F4EF95|nr:Xaa-Pro peptidase family protein [Cucumibacter marinus]
MPSSETRLAALRTRMKDTGTDLVALGPSSHMWWLSGVSPHGDERPVMLLVSQTGAAFLMPALNADAARLSTGWLFHTWNDADGPDAAMAELLAGLALPAQPSVVLDETMRADFALYLLGKLPGATHSFTAGTVGYLRARKDPEEYRRLKQVHLLNDKAFEIGFAACKPGVTETDIVKVIAEAYAGMGADIAFIHVAFGGNGAFPHHSPGKTRLETGMAIQIDAGCRFENYPSDMTRCGWLGDPPADYLDVAGIVEKAVRAALAAARAGVPASDVDRAAREVIEAAGYGDRFPHRTGHGLGIDIHEEPYITASNVLVLDEGMVFSIEPGIYLPDRFGIRLEEIVILRADGPEILSAMPRDIVSVPA